MISRGDLRSRAHFAGRAPLSFARRLRSAATLFLAIAAPLSEAPASIIAPADLPDLVDKTLPGVVNVSSTTVLTYEVFGMDDFLRLWGIPQEHKQTSLGSGFLIDKDGYVITNNHVVDRATEVLITLRDKRSFPAKVIGKDQKMDLALLQIRDQEKKVPGDLKPVPLGDSSTVRIAEGVFAVGNPFGLEHTVTLGIISAKDRTIGQGPFDNFLQTDASINPGNSGGPLLNLKGEVVGINTVIISRTGQTAGLGFAIPINEAKALIADLKRYGRVPRPWLGIVAQGVTPQLQRYYRLQASKGVLVVNLIEGGPADSTGLEQGDIISEVDGGSVADPNELERKLSKRRPTETAMLKVLRGKRSLEIKIKLEELPKFEGLPRGII